ncbi:MAG: DNA polymerase I [Chloroflexi bacterium]|nr:DNA polymerase I [Chloroflexota bacterium]
MDENINNNKTLLVLDGFAIIFRVYYSRQPMSTSTGVPTTIVQGFLSILFKLIKEVNPTHIVLAMDSKGPTFRHDNYPEYKAGRDPAPPDLTEQIPILEKVIKSFGIPLYSIEKYEADDVIGTVSVSEKTKDFKKVIVSGDKDLFQLINHNTSVWYSSPNRFSSDRLVSKETYPEEKGFEGVMPENVPDLKGLAGDSSDNIKGIPGIGQKVALSLLNKYKDLETIYKNIEEIPLLEIRGASRVQNLLNEYKDNAFQSRELATIRIDAPINLNIEDTEFWNFDEKDVVDALSELELMSLIKRIPSRNDTDSDDKLIPFISGEYRCANNDSMINLIEKLIIKKKSFSFDTETSSLSPFEADLVGISISTEKGTGWYIPVNHSSGNNISESNLTKIKLLFENEEIEKFAHNANYDVSVLVNNEFKINNLNFDTLIAANLLNKRSLSLKNLCLEILGLQMTSIEEMIGKGKDQISFKDVDIEKAVNYASADADATFRLKEIFEDELSKIGLQDVMNKIEIPLIPVIVEMQKSGVSINSQVLNKISLELKNEISDLELRAKNIIGNEEVNLRSSQQLSDILINQMNIPEKWFRKTAKKTQRSTDVSNLQSLLTKELDEETREFIEIILRHREQSKLQNTYAEPLPKLVNQKTGRLHPNFNQAGTLTGRLSSNDPNLQNIPVRTENRNQIRKAFESRKGHVLMSADYSQIELRVLAHLSEEPSLLKAFNNNEDIHESTAKTIYQINEVTKEQRRIAKILNFGVIYGLGPDGVSRQTDLTRSQGKEFIDIYFGKYPGIKNYINNVINFAKKNMYVETLTKRRRLIPEINSNIFQIRNSSERMAINMPIQGTAADVIKIAMININKEIKNQNLVSKMIIQIHDELIFEVPKEEIFIMESMLRESMSSALELKVPLTVDISYADNWGDLK